MDEKLTNDQGQHDSSQDDSDPQQDHAVPNSAEESAEVQPALEEQKEGWESADEETGEEVEPLSITDKIIGVYTEPEPTFENVKAAGPRVTDWLIPFTLLIVISVIVTVVRFNDPAFIEMIMDQQEQRLADMIEKGEMTVEQAEAAMDQMGNMGAGMFMAISMISIAIFIPIVMLFMTLIYWGGTKIFKGTAGFHLVLATLGLVTYISILAPLLDMLVGFVTGNPLASFSAAAFMEYKAGDSLYILMSFLHPIQIFGTFVLGIGLHKVATLSKGKALGIVFGLWIIWAAIASIAGFQPGGMG